MSPSTPTTAEIADNIVSQLELAFNSTILPLPKSFVRVLAKTLAGVFVLLYKYVGFGSLQMFVRTATYDETVINGVTVRPLQEWGRLVGIEDKKAATAAELQIEITVEAQTGFLPAGSTQLLSTLNGVTYVLTSAVALDAATVVGTVQAVADQAGGDGRGALGNLEPGATLSFANPLANVGRTVTVLAQTVTGANAESVDAYRQRILDRFQKRPQGGARADYELWGEEAPGIINVYPYTSDCPGQVDVYAEATAASSGSPDGIPTTAQLQAVKTAIEFDIDGLASRRPLGALVSVFPISRLGFEVEISGLSVEGAAQVEADIVTAVEEYFLQREPFLAGLTVPPRSDRITRSGISGVVDDIVSAAGGIFTSVSLTRQSLPIETYTLGVGEKAKATAVTFV